MVKRIWLVPVLLLPVLILATLPAAVVLPRLNLPANLAQIGGTVWSGSAHWQQAGWQALDIRWQWQGGREWHWDASGGKTRLHGSWRLGKPSVLPEISGQLELARLDLTHWLSIARPGGVLELDVADVVFSETGAIEAQGRIVWREAELRGAIQESLGNIEIRISEAAADGEAINLAVESLAPSPIQLRGLVVMNAERYEADLWFKAAPGRSDLTASLAAIGDLQPDGQVRLKVGGSTGLKDR